MTEQEFEQVKDVVWSNITTLTKNFGHLPTDDEFQTVADRIKPVLSILLPNITVSGADYKKILRAVRADFTVQMEGDEAFITSDEHEKWLDSVKSNVDWFFWTRYEKYLHTDKKWSPELIASLDTTTDKIFDLTGNPNSAENFSRRGLIIGEVQSGKTATYTALCAKAADAGYKVIIVLTGTLEDLRRQTQARLDFEFVGRKSQDFLSKHAAIKNSLIGVAKYGTKKSIQQPTAVGKDFSAAALPNLSGLKLSGSGDAPFLFVVKKNKSVLENLIAWLKQSVNFGESKLNHSLLLLDDEADNASINTKKNYLDEQTAINACIREILNSFRQTTYIGVTATPFANIFINPFDVSGMLNDDLFPKDFIYALDVPNNYIGAEKIFGGDYQNMIETIQPDDCPDVEEIFPKRHKKYLRVNELPESLCEAINYFLLVNAIRDLRGDTKTHRTMLIHVSRFTNVHNQIYSLVETRLREIVRDLRAYAAEPANVAEKKSANIAALRKIFDRFSLEKVYGTSWEKFLRDYLYKAVVPVKVGLRNSTGKNSFSYEQHPDGLRVIAIGGNSFSRGLTLEGLCVTYFYRSSRNYDTLMQMGRWFGYRPNYGDLCRLWTTQEIVDWYGFIADVSAELKQEISFMNATGKTPKDFGLRVRRHPDTLEITAQNKMRFTEKCHVPVALNKVFIETPQFANEAEILSANKNLILKFIDGLKSFPCTEKNFWRDVPKNLVANLILNFQADSWQHNFQSQPVSEYINHMDDEFWDVAIPEGDGDEFIIDGKPIKPLVRKVFVDENQIKVGASKRRIGRAGATKRGLTSEQLARIEDDFRKVHGNKKISIPDNFYMIHGRRPLLVLSVISPKPDNFAKSVPEILFALGVGFPAASPDISEANVKTANFVINAIGNSDDFTSFDFNDEDGDDE